MEKFSILDFKQLFLHFGPQAMGALQNELAFACRCQPTRLSEDDDRQPDVSIDMIDTVLAEGEVHLGFSPVLEQHYLLAKQPVRAAALDNFLIFSGVLFAMTILLDWIQYPAILWLCLWVKLGGTPVIVTTARTALRHWPQASNLVALGSAIAYQLMVLGYFLVSETAATNPVIFVFALVAISTNILIEQSFPMAVLCGLTTIVSASVAALISPGLDLSYGIFSLSIVIIFVFFTLFGAIRMDVSGRLTFLYSQKEKLRIEKLALDNQSLQYLADVDGLTGVLNRRSFETGLQETMAHSSRRQAPMGLLLVDLDHFKQLNDVHGHLAGDLCLQAVAAVLSGQAAKASGLVARYGGEEFAIILPSTSPEAMARTAEAVRNAIETSPVAVNSDNPLSVTASIGCVCAIPSSECTAKDLIKFADIALYEAKKAGRNCVKTSAPRHKCAA